MAEDNQEVYEALKPFDEISLDCYGYVSAVREEGIEAVLILPDGKELKRLFNSDLSKLCAENGVHFQDASFRFIVTKYQGKFSNHIINERPPKGYPGTAEMPEIDFSIFDEFKPKKISE